MLSILNLPSSLQCGSATFPVPGEQYFEPAARQFRPGGGPGDLVGDNQLVDSNQIAELIKHHLRLGPEDYSKMTWGTFNTTGTWELKDYINNDGRVELLNVPQEIGFNGNAKQFVDELDAVPTKFPNKILTFTATLCYVFPRSF